MKPCLPPPDGRLLAAALPSTRRLQESSYPLRHPGIERVAQSVAQHVHREHGDGEEHPRKEYVVRVADELHASLGHDVAPGRDVGRQATPRKDRIASSRIAKAQMYVPCTSSGAMVFGRMWPNMIFAVGVPSDTAAST